MLFGRVTVALLVVSANYALVKGLGNIALRQSTGRCTTTVSCDTVMDKGVQPEPINSLGLTPEFVDIDGRSYLNVLPEEGFWDVKSPYYDMGCNYTNNIDAWVFRFTTPEPYHVYLDMIAYDIEEKIPGNCTAGDFMRVQRVAPDNVVLCGTDCNFQTFTSNNQELVVRFKSDNEITRGGFFFQISGIPVLRAVIPD